jgi:hypothetical protein
VTRLGSMAAVAWLATSACRQQGDRRAALPRHDVVARYLDMWNTGESSIARVILHRDGTDHARPKVTGPDGVRQAVDGLRAAQPDPHFGITAILDEDDLVAAVGDVRRGHSTDATGTRLIWLIRAALKFSVLWRLVSGFR